MTHRVSVVICTLNRAESLRDTLRCLRFQRYDQFEVVVVNGPSTDATDDVLAEFADVIRIRTNPLANLSVSRNIGIDAAAGDVVAFIDDDALPEFDWLRQALPAFRDETVGGVGGIVFDHSGMALQYRYSAANRYGEATSRTNLPYDDFAYPGSFVFPYLQGTNALFRRSALEEIGGFDETYDYYLDETDVCCRMVDAGWLLRQLHDAPVHHKFLPSGIRNPERVVTNWFPIIKNQTYFAYRHALGVRSEIEVIDRCRASVERWHADALFHERGGRLPAGTADRVLRIGGEAMGVGMRLGHERHDLRLERRGPATEPFRRYPVVDSWRRRCIAIVTGDYPPRSTGGIARFLGDVTRPLAELGHEVRVITRAGADRPGTVDLEDGVWVHRIETPPVPDGGLVPQALPHIDAFVTASAAELDRIGTWRAIDVVYGPAWDVDVLGALRTLPVPVVAMLATPIAVAARHAGWANDAAGAANLARLVELEKEVFTDAHLLHGISAAILDTVREEYAIELDPVRGAVAHIGLRDRAPTTTRARRRPGPVRVLFVGRLEVRKGIDDLLAAIPTVAARHPDVEWLIAGGETRGPLEPSHETLFRHRHRSAAWLRNVRFLGNVDDEHLDGLYEEADIVVLPSRYESFGLVMVEAMMHARPQVTCAIGGIEEVVRDGEDALLVPPASPRELADAIEALLRSASRRRALGTAGRRRYEQELTIDVAARRLDALLSRVRFSRVDGPAITALDPGPMLIASGGHPAFWITRRTRVVVSPAERPARRFAMVHADSGHQIVLRTRASLAQVIDLRRGWTSVELPRTRDDVVLTLRRGEPIFGGLVSVEPEPT